MAERAERDLAHAEHRPYSPRRAAARLDGIIAEIVGLECAPIWMPKATDAQPQTPPEPDDADVSD